MSNTHINQNVIQRRHCTQSRSSVFILDAELADMLLACRQAMDRLEIPKVCECLLQRADGGSSQDKLIAIIEDSDDELCFKVGDGVSWVVECLFCVLLWRDTASSPIWLSVLQELLNLEGVANVGEADDDDSVLAEVLVADANERVE